MSAEVLDSSKSADQDLEKRIWEASRAPVLFKGEPQGAWGLIRSVHVPSLRTICQGPGTVLALRPFPGGPRVGFRKDLIARLLDVASRSSYFAGMTMFLGGPDDSHDPPWKVETLKHLADSWMLTSRWAAVGRLVLLGRVPEAWGDPPVLTPEELAQRKQNRLKPLKGPHVTIREVDPWSGADCPLPEAASCRA